MSLSRWIGFTDDPTTGGSTFDVLTGAGELSPIDIPVPDLFVPATSATVDAGQTPHDRTDEVRGRRGDTAPVSFISAPKLTVDARCYPVILRKLIRSLLGGAIDKAGGPSPAAFENTVHPLEEGELPCLVGWLKRENQLDRLTGLAPSSLALTFDVDKEGTFQATFDALFHQVHDIEGAVEPESEKAAKSVESADYSADIDTFMLRDASAFLGSEEVEMEELAGFSLTYDNGLIQDIVSRFRPNHNVSRKTIETVLHKLWYPNQHKLGPQQVTGKFELSGVDPDQEARRLLSHADQLVFEVAAGPLGTTPAADEMMKIVVAQMVSTGGGAEPLVRQGDQRASFDFSGYLSSDGTKDVEVEFVGATELT